MADGSRRHKDASGKLESPSSQFTVRSAETKSPIPADGSPTFSGRVALIALGGALEKASELSGPGSFWADRLKEHEEAEAARQAALRALRDTVVFEPALGVRERMSKAFPFVRDPALVNFHPNTDNQLLKAYGVGDEGASLLDHLRGRGPCVSGCLSDAFIVEDSALAHKPNLKLFSYGTLAQSLFFDAAWRGVPVRGEDFLGPFAAVRRNFYPRAVNVVVGSPTGNRISALMRGKVRRSEFNRTRELRHEGIPGLILPYEFSLDSDQDPSIYDQASGRYSWSILQRRGAVPYRAQGDHDFFLVSVLPNYLVSRFTQLPPVVLIEGCSSLGTTGTSVLWTDAGRLELDKLLSQVGRHKSKYWQALFRVDAATKPDKNPLTGRDERRATRVQLIGFEWVRTTRELAAHPVRIRRSLQEDLSLLANRVWA